MGKQAKIIIKESSDELHKLISKTQNYRVKLRLKSLLYTQSKKFKTQSELSSHLGISYSSLKYWLKQYREEGLDSFMCLKSGGNKKSLITLEIHNELAKRLTSSTNPFQGYWDVQRLIKDKFDESFEYNTIRTYLIRHFKTKLKSPRKSHYKKDEQAIEAFFKTSTRA